ncbi:hypothetical protein KC19_1G238900 [Ceratodon purpureus]|uniref:Uncharacterized protein n=1 Tax=Ceratodon purpureus TaxID=3225 RepID=A0A8T0JAI5_CERPU|nr:hypothetical protein KC19_1G238900 [Ceratodon purpureus]
MPLMAQGHMLLRTAWSSAAVLGNPPLRTPCKNLIHCRKRRCHSLPLLSSFNHPASTPSLPQVTDTPPHPLEPKLTQVTTQNSLLWNLKQAPKHQPNHTIPHSEPKNSLPLSLSSRKTRLKTSLE